MPIGIVGITLTLVEVTGQTLSTLDRGDTRRPAPIRSLRTVQTLLVLTALGALGWLLVAPSTAAFILLIASVIGTLGWNGAPKGALDDVLDV